MAQQIPVQKNKRMELKVLVGNVAQCGDLGLGAQSPPHCRKKPTKKQRINVLIMQGSEEEVRNLLEEFGISIYKLYVHLYDNFIEGYFPFQGNSLNFGCTVFYFLMIFSGVSHSFYYSLK